MKTQNGFTLVELAIVMVIIGVLLGGVLKGQELVTNAKASATVSQIKEIEAAFNTFQDAYGSVPGDFANSATRLPNCTVGTICSYPTGHPSANAAGNGHLETGPGEGRGATNIMEAYPFFVHLAAADLIGGVNVMRGTTSSDAQSGEYFPETPIGGLYHAGWSSGTSDAGFSGIIGQGANIPRRGHYVALHGGTPHLPLIPDNPTRGQLLQPSHALRIDNKLDDGNPYTGFVRGGGTAGTTDSNCATATDYNGVSTQPVCYLYIRLGG